MYSATSLIIMFFIGTYTGAQILYLFRKIFVKDVEKLLVQKSKELQGIVQQNFTESYKEFQNYHDLMQVQAGHTLSMQENILNNHSILLTKIDHLHREVQSAHNVRVTLENEITKLKNIIKRTQNKNKE
jgi:hypothetical protein